MKALPSIAFQDFSGTAKDVTARSTSGGTVLSVRSYPCKVYSQSQRARRNALATISRAYRQLTEPQMKEWAVLAGKLKGTPLFGKSAELTAHNAFVRINTNRQMAGMSLLADAPVYCNSIPVVKYEDLWISRNRIIFLNIEQPSDDFVLVFKMTPAMSPGVSSDQGKMVIITPGLEPEYGDAELTKLYTEVKGMKLQEGGKYFCEFWWLDRATGFTGPSTSLNTICKDTSVGSDAVYVPRAIVEMEYGETNSDNYLYDVEIGFTKGSALVNANLKYEYTQSRVNGYFDVPDMPDSVPTCAVLVLGRGYKYSKSSVNLIRLEILKDDESRRLHVAPEVHESEQSYDMFDGSVAF